MSTSSARRRPGCRGLLVEPSVSAPSDGLDECARRKSFRRFTRVGHGSCYSRIYPVQSPGAGTRESDTPHQGHQGASRRRSSPPMPDPGALPAVRRRLLHHPKSRTRVGAGRRRRRPNVSQRGAAIRVAGRRPQARAHRRGGPFSLVPASIDDRRYGRAHLVSSSLDTREEDAQSV